MNQHISGPSKAAKGSDVQDQQNSMFRRGLDTATTCSHDMTTLSSYNRQTTDGDDDDDNTTDILRGRMKPSTRGVANSEERLSPKLSEEPNDFRPKNKKTLSQVVGKKTFVKKIVSVVYFNLFLSPLPLLPQFFS
jgi:hypothetical protein